MNGVELNETIRKYIHAVQTGSATLGHEAGEWTYLETANGTTLQVQCKHCFARASIIISHDGLRESSITLRTYVCPEPQLKKGTNDGPK